MKYLESISDEDLIQFGLNTNELKWYFTDLIDEGFNLRIVPMKKLLDFGGFETEKKLGLINYVSIRFIKNKKDESAEFLRSEEFKLMIEEANYRLLQIGLFIKNTSIAINTTNLIVDIFIYRESDKKYIK